MFTSNGELSTMAHRLVRPANRKSHKQVIGKGWERRKTTGSIRTESYSLHCMILSEDCMNSDKNGVAHL